MFIALRKHSINFYSREIILISFQFKNFIIPFLGSLGCLSLERRAITRSALPAVSGVCIVIYNVKEASAHTKQTNKLNKVSTQKKEAMYRSCMCILSTLYKL